jgi:hypothetical protein
MRCARRADSDWPVFSISGPNKERAFCTSRGAGAMQILLTREKPNLNLPPRESLNPRFLYQHFESGARGDADIAKASSRFKSAQIP